MASYVCQYKEAIGVGFFLGAMFRIVFELFYCFFQKIKIRKKEIKKGLPKDL